MRERYFTELNTFLNEQVEKEELEIIEDAIKTGNSFSMDQLQNMGVRFKNIFINQMLCHDSEIKQLLQQTKQGVNSEKKKTKML